jgi:tetratricopeptide (TPR) repeat protein
MKKSVLFLSILLGVQLLHSQNQEKDSIKNLLAKAKDDTVSLSILDKLIFLKTWSNPEEALELAKQELLLAQKAKLSLAEANALANNASVLSVLGDYSHAIEYYLQCIKLSEQFKFNRSLQNQRVSEQGWD